MNTASWDSNFPDPAIASDLSAAGTGLIRYPGGSYADGYLWQPNTYQGTADPVDFAQYSSQVDAITGGQKFVTVNYGSDTPADAAAWVTQSATSGQGVSLWEIGNEEYGSWEIDDHTNPHTAASYASNGLAYMQAMKAANPNAQICYDYAMDGNLAPGSGVTDYQDWNDTILQADAADINCADVHWYPINGTPSESVQSIMELIDNIPRRGGRGQDRAVRLRPERLLRRRRDQHVADRERVERGAGRRAVRGGQRDGVAVLRRAERGLVGRAQLRHVRPRTSACSPRPPAASPPWTPRTPPYYGYQLASKLAVKGAKVGTLAVATPNIYGYYSDLPGGSYAVMLVNADPANGYSVSTSSLGLTSSSETEYTYSAASPSVDAEQLLRQFGVGARRVGGGADQRQRRRADADADPDQRRRRPRRPRRRARPATPPPTSPPPTPHRDRDRARRQLPGDLVGGELVERRLPARLHRDQPGQRGHVRLERQLLLARHAGHHPDLERHRDPVRGRGQRDQRQLRRVAGRGRVDHVRPARLRDRARLAGFGAMHRALTHWALTHWALTHWALTHWALSGGRARPG